MHPKLHIHQVGDTLDFENMLYEPHGTTWADKVMMITKTSRTPNQLKVSVREVGSL
jgi:hypothetical protein